MRFAPEQFLPPPPGAPWRVWAPAARHVTALLGDGREIPLAPDASGFHHDPADQPAEAGQRYAYRLDGGPPRPDPCSAWQPDGVHRPSAVVAWDRFAWTDQAWRGVERADLVLYELHAGTFTAAGTLDAVIPRLPELRDLGVTAVELMPVAQFPGGRGWGYDGVHAFAVQDTYGGPAALQRLVDACHAQGLAVILDVVYNHCGPEGNYLAEFGPYFTDRYRTPWGPAFNYDQPGSDAVRAYVLANVRWWIEVFHLDGLRLDAVEAIFDHRPRHLLREIQEAAAAAAPGRTVHVIAETHANDGRWLRPPERGGCGLSAQWCDDFHHAVHACLTGERWGHYADFGRPEDVATAWERTHVLCGQYSRYRDRSLGEPVPDLAGDRFVVCVQNHDQIGNRPLGERLAALLEPAAQRLAASLLLLGPNLPLLFMGEEYGEDRPFLFFCDFGDPRVIDGVRRGRRHGFAVRGVAGDTFDPQDPQTLERSRLSWAWAADPHRAGLRRLYQDLLQARRTWPGLRDFSRREARFQDGVLELRRGAGLVIWANPSPQPKPLTVAGAWRFRSEDPRYTGREAAPADGVLGAWECVVLDVGEKVAIPPPAPPARLSD